MDRSRLHPMDLPAITVYGNGSVKGKASFVRRLAIGFVILAILGLLYVPAYHSAQSPFLSLSETPSSAEPLGNSHLVASTGMHLMKTDDDMFVNIPLLLKTLHSITQVETLLGSLICNAKPITDPKNKWYTPKYMYSEKTYPNYLSGTGYVMSMGVASKLYQAALITPLLHLEDVYVTGLCAKRAKVRPVNHPGFSYIPRKIDPCVLRNAITAHKVNASNMYVIWVKMNDTSVTCSNRTRIERKPITLSRSGRNAGGYYVYNRGFKRKTINKCV